MSNRIKQLFCDHEVDMNNLENIICTKCGSKRDLWIYNGTTKLKQWRGKSSMEKIKQGREMTNDEIKKELKELGCRLWYIEPLVSKKEWGIFTTIVLVLITVAL